MSQRDRRIVPGVVGLAVLVVWACQPESGDAQVRGREAPIPVPPGQEQPPRPTGGAPESCRLLPAPERVPHWERQSALVMKLATVRGRPERVASARLEMVHRPGLEALQTADFARQQAVARLTLEQPHNGLAPGAYCLTAIREGAGAGTWRTFLYALDRPDAQAVAWVPFLYRADPTNDPQGHPRALLNRRPYPPARFEFALRSQLTPGRAREAPAPVAPPPTQGPDSAITTVIDPSWLASAIWFTCGDGCCSGGVEALRTY